MKVNDSLIKKQINNLVSNGYKLKKIHELVNIVNPDASFSYNVTFIFTN